MGVRLKTVGGSTNWLAPYMAAHQILAHSNDAIADALGDGGAMVGAALTGKKVRAQEQANRDRAFGLQQQEMAQRVHEAELGHAQWGAQYLQSRLLQMDETDPDYASVKSSLDVVTRKLGLDGGGGAPRSAYDEIASRVQANPVTPAAAYDRVPKIGSPVERGAANNSTLDDFGGDATGPATAGDAPAAPSDYDLIRQQMMEAQAADQEIQNAEADAAHWRAKGNMRKAKAAEDAAVLAAHKKAAAMGAMKEPSDRVATRKSAEAESQRRQADAEAKSLAEAADVKAYNDAHSKDEGFRPVVNADEMKADIATRKYGATTGAMAERKHQWQMASQEDRQAFLEKMQNERFGAAKARNDDSIAAREKVASVRAAEKNADAQDKRAKSVLDEYAQAEREARTRYNTLKTLALKGTIDPEDSDLREAFGVWETARGAWNGALEEYAHPKTLPENDRAKADAAAEFNALKPEEQTKDAWEAIKKRRGI